MLALLLIVVASVTIYLNMKAARAYRMLYNDLFKASKELLNYSEVLPHTSDLTKDQHHHVKVGIKIAYNRINSALDESKLKEIDLPVLKGD